MKFFKDNKILTIILLILSFYLYNNYFILIEPNSKVDKNSRTYINDLYASDERIYNNYLETSEQIIYKKLVSASQNHIPTIYFKSITDGLDVKKIYDAIIVDHPELLNFGSLRYKYSTAGDYEITINSATPLRLLTAFNMSRIQRIIHKIKEDTKDLNDYGKIKYVYNWIGKKTKYDKTFTYMSKNQSAYNVFINKNAVCAGFAKACQIIFQNIGIESYGVSGHTTGPHMWNIVKYKGKYYFFDSTVAASISETSEYYYDGLKQTAMKEYMMDNPEWYPEIETTNME